MKKPSKASTSGLVSEDESVGEEDHESGPSTGKGKSGKVAPAFHILKAIGSFATKNAQVKPASKKAPKVADLETDESPKDKKHPSQSGDQTNQNSKSYKNSKDPAQKLGKKEPKG